MPKSPSTSSPETPVLDSPPETTTSTTTATLESPQPAKAKQSRSPLFQAPATPPGPKTGSLAADAPAASPSTSTPDAPPAPPARALSTAPASPSNPEPGTAQVKKPVKAEIRKFLQQAVEVSTKAMHRGLTIGNDVERNAGVWIATAEQVEAIADPATALVMDHVPPALLQSAVMNAFRLLFAVGDYVNHHLDTKLALRRSSPKSTNPQVQPQNDVTGEMSRA